MIDCSEYKKRRSKLAQKIGKDNIAIIIAATEIIRNGDVHFNFRQNSDFYYLTGFNEPDCLLIIEGETARAILFNRPRDLKAEIWNGNRLGQEDAPAHLEIDTAYSIESLEEILPKFLNGPKKIYCSDKDWQFLKKSTPKIKQEVFQDLTPIISEMRLFKSSNEIKAMEHAANVSVKAHEHTMRNCKPGLYEFELEASLLYEFKKGGCNDVAYPPIVASGNQACILHYTENKKLLNKGDLVLIDAGGEYMNYAADITRTFPVNGKFTLEQNYLYELVLNAQQTAIAKIKPGLKWNEIQKTLVEILTAGLIDLKILKGSLSDLVEQEAYKPFYMHNSGHWLGLDVHDVGSYKENNEWRALQPGMVLTVEPGLYISKKQTQVDPRWQGIGIRIEDDILVTESGFKNLTGALPVAIDQIEALVGSEKS